MRHGVNIAALQHDGKIIRNNLWRLSLFIHLTADEFEKRELAKEQRRKASLCIFKRSLPGQRICPSIASQFMKYFVRKLEKTRKDRISTPAAPSPSRNDETHFLLTFIPLFTGRYSARTIRSLKLHLSEEILLRRVQAIAESPITPKQYCQRALEINELAAYALSEIRTRHARLHFVSNVVCRNLNNTFRFTHSWLKLSPKQAIHSLESKLRVSRHAMHLFWYFFWRGDTIEPRVLLLITTLQLQESFLRLFSDASKEKLGSPQDSEAYSVLPRDYGLCNLENLSFHGTAMATRTRFAPHRVSRLYMCEGSHHPKSFTRQIILSEYYEKYHVVCRLKKNTMDGNKIKYGCYEKIPNVWRFMLQQASGNGEPQISTTIRLFECIRLIHRNFQRADSVHKFDQANLTPLELLQRKIGLKINLAQSTIARQRSTEQPKREKIEILPHEKRLHLFIKLSMQILKSGMSDVKHHSYSLATQTSRKTRKHLFLPSELSSFLDAFVSCYTADDQAKVVDFGTIQHTLESLFIPGESEIAKMIRASTLPALAETLYSRDTVALWCGWRVVAMLLGKSIDSITQEKKRIKSNKRPATPMLRWRALEAIVTTLRFTPQQAFVAFFVQLMVCVGESDRPISTRLTKIILCFVRNVLSKAGKVTFFQSLSVVLFMVHVKSHHSKQASPFRQNSDVKACTAKYTDRLVRQMMATQRFSTRQRSSGFQKSALVLPFLLVVNPTVAKVLCSYGYWESALAMHSVLHASYAETMKRLTITDKSQTVQCTYSKVSRSLSAMILMRSHSPAMWRVAADFLHSTNPKRDVQLIQVRNGDDRLIGLRLTCAFVCSRLCVGGDFPQAVALATRADEIVKGSLHPTDLRRIILFLLREQRNWHTALQVAATLRQNLQSARRPSALNGPFERTKQSWLPCLAYAKCMKWEETLRLFRKEIEVQTEIKLAAPSPPSSCRE
ncbi:ATP-binding region ATPase domain protein [Perkinsela sp. CCAP 1560/4]|nr:ATP-binding region ATPase domain protein [Perkinsela sp. CCAP 1560/4]|eukprot:KNH06634.1 ATP-binding region ATPase domain protein [Perkinsela sp. CCAP 1560/4]